MRQIYGALAAGALILAATSVSAASNKVEISEKFNYVVNKIIETGDKKSISKIEAIGRYIDIGLSYSLNLNRITFPYESSDGAIKTIDLRIEIDLEDYNPISRIVSGLGNSDVFSMSLLSPLEDSLEIAIKYACGGLVLISDNDFDMNYDTIVIYNPGCKEIALTNTILSPKDKYSSKKDKEKGKEIYDQAINFLYQYFKTSENKKVRIDKK